MPGRGPALSEIVAELVRVRDAFDKPTLRLLDRKWAPVVLAVFRTTFTRDQRTVPAERLHQQVDNYLDELRLAGKPVPDGTGRALCHAVARAQLARPHPR